METVFLARMLPPGAARKASASRPGRGAASGAFRAGLTRSRRKEALTFERAGPQKPRDLSLFTAAATAEVGLYELRTATGQSACGPQAVGGDLRGWPRASSAGKNQKHFRANPAGGFQLQPGRIGEFGKAPALGNGRGGAAAKNMRADGEMQFIHQAGAEQGVV